jgi:hypothetical protein
MYTFVFPGLVSASKISLLYARVARVRVVTTIDVVGEHMARPDAITEMCFENVSLSEYGRICTGLRTDSQNRVF